MDEIQNDRERHPIRPKLMLLEFDERFAVFKDDFAFYDYKQPIKLDRKDRINSFTASIKLDRKSVV